MIVVNLYFEKIISLNLNDDNKDNKDKEKTNEENEENNTNNNNTIEKEEEKPEKEKEINTINNNNTINTTITNLIEIEELKFKISNSAIILISHFFDVFKMLLICDDSLMPHISDSLCFHITKYLDITNEIVLLGEGVQKGKLRAITQKEISTVCANATIVKKIIKIFSCNQLLTAIFADLKEKIDTIINTCKCKISDLFEHA